MRITTTKIPDLLVIEPKIFRDERGFFVETWQEQRYREAGICGPFVQDNHSRSAKGILRGLHYQIHQAQGKLIRVSVGSVFDVAVDLRRSSPTFGQWFGIELNADTQTQLWVPPGFAHGFYVTSDVAEFQYKCTDYYAAEHERTLRWDDPDLGIDWPLIDGQMPLLSEKDRRGSGLKEAEVFA